MKFSQEMQLNLPGMRLGTAGTREQKTRWSGQLQEAIMGRRARTLKMGYIARDDLVAAMSTAPREMRARTRAVPPLVGVRAMCMAAVTPALQTVIVRLATGPTRRLAAVRCSLGDGLAVTRTPMRTKRVTAAIPTPPEFRAQDLLDLVRQSRCTRSRCRSALSAGKQRIENRGLSLSLREI